MAQGLQVAAVREPLPVALVGLDVVHVRGPGAQAMLGALPAIRLPQELVGPEIVRPLWAQIQPVPGGAVGAALCLGPGLVSGAVAVWHQDAAAWMPTRSQRFLAHGYHLMADKKTPETMTTLAGVSVMGSGVLRSGLVRYAG